MSIKGLEQTLVERRARIKNLLAEAKKLCDELGVEVPEDEYEPLEFFEPTEEQRAEARALWEKHFGKFIADALFGEEENEQEEA